MGKIEVIKHCKLYVNGEELRILTVDEDKTTCTTVYINHDMCEYMDIDDEINLSDCSTIEKLLIECLTALRNCDKKYIELRRELRKFGKVGINRLEHWVFIQQPNNQKATNTTTNKNI